MKKFKKYSFSILILLLLSGCLGLNKERFSYYGQYNSKLRVLSAPLRIDGFYHYEYRSSREKKTSNIYMFYDDGIFFRHSSDDCFNILEEINPICCGIHDGTRNSCNWCWGAYLILKDTIKIQYFGTSFIFPRNIIEKIGIIENDSTIHFFKSINYTRSFYFPITERRPFSQTYHFKQCSSKPDSLNKLFHDDFEEQMKIRQVIKEEE